MQALSGVLGAGLGGLSGAFANQKEGARNAGNVMLNPAGDSVRHLQEESLNSAMHNGSTVGQYGDPTQQVQNNPMLSGVFGQGGTLDRTGQEEKDLSSRGYSLKPEDYEAYGQASGDIARQFGESDQSLSQALSNRGLSNSGAAGAAFTGSQGNKLEQLAGVQRQIANDRMKTNMERLGQTRQFLSQLGGQGENAIQGQFGRNMQSSNEANQNNANKFNMTQGLLGNFQKQLNEGLSQEQQTEHKGSLGNIVGGMSSGFAAGGGAGKPTSGGMA